MDCIFCKIVAGEIPSQKVYEDEDFVGFLDIKPVNPGHTLVVPKKHSADLFETDDEVLKKAGPTLKKIASGVMKAVGASGFNLGLNNGPSAGQVVFHLHFHIMPRFEKDERDLWVGKTYEAGKAEAVAEKIRNYFERNK